MADLNSLGGIHYEMMKRCYNPKSVMWKWYGEKGIGVCEEWHDREVFKKWARENGYEKGMRLERKDSSRDYCPDNCYFGDSLKAKHGRNQLIKEHRRLTKRRKSELGLKNYSESRLHNILSHMIDRCHNPNNAVYKNYGGRGITVCNEWRRKGGEGIYNFIKWYKENGWLELDDPTIQTIDRIDPNGDYCPENCRFITLQEQQRNKRNVVIYNYYGENLTLRQIAIKEKVNYDKLRKMVTKEGIDIFESLKCLKK